MGVTRMIKIGIMGAAGYTGGELIRLLAHHPQVEIAFLYSRSQAGKPICEVHNDLFSLKSLRFTNKINIEVDLLFLCMGHGASTQFLKETKLKKTVRIIDLSHDFRYKDFPNRKFVYGLPELNKQAIIGADNIANPGCFATAIQLSFLPLLQKKWLSNDLHISGITGSTGAGVSLSETTHFSWRNNNISTYKLFKHQHLGEITQTIKKLNGRAHPIHFVPYRGNFSRGIIITAYSKVSVGFTQIKQAYAEGYKQMPFTHYVNKNPDLKQVINTNHAQVYIEQHGAHLVSTTIIDNLLKGASGQAVQNMNLMFGFEETEALNLKAMVY